MLGAHPRLNSGLNIQDPRLVSHHSPSTFTHSLFELTVLTMKAATFALVLSFFVSQASASKSPDAGQGHEDKPASMSNIQYSGCNTDQVKEIDKAATYVFN